VNKKITVAIFVPTSLYCFRIRRWKKS